MYEIGETEMKRLQEMVRFLGHDSKNRTANNMISIIHTGLMKKISDNQNLRHNQNVINNFMEAFEALQRASNV